MIRTAIAALMALTCSAASADVISSTGVDVKLKIERFANGYATVDVTQDSWGSIRAGQLQGVLATGESFLTYCVDLGQTFSWNREYTFSLQDTGFSTPRQADLLGKLYTVAHSSNGLAATTNDSVAFQLAVWEILYEGTPASVTAGDFKLVSGASTAQRELADSWLSAVTQVGAARSFNAQRLYSSVAQDFVLFSPIPIPVGGGGGGGGAVPEPSSIVLAGLALAALAGLRRRRA